VQWIRYFKSFMPKKTSLKSLDEFYSAVDNLIERLKSVGNIEEANKLDSLMHQTAWTTSSELLGELMLALKGMKGNYSSGIAKEIGECLEFAKNHRRILKLN
jgi:hypothetical protein